MTGCGHDHWFSVQSLAGKYDKETEQFDVEVSIFNIKSSFKFLGECQNRTLKL